MQLVLLPGMDGTGELFAPLLPYLSEINVKIIPLPQSGEQNYPALASYVKSELPYDDIVLVAESFSGPIAAILAQNTSIKIKGIIFVASFLSPPSQLLLKLASFMPVKTLAKLPLAKHAYRYLFLGENAHNSLVNLFQEVLLQLPSTIIKSRLHTMRTLHWRGLNIALPAIYILPLSDRLVAPRKSLECKKYCNDLQLMKVDGPHFILQAQPQACATIILNFWHKILNAA